MSQPTEPTQSQHPVSAEIIEIGWPLAPDVLRRQAQQKRDLAGFMRRQAGEQRGLADALETEATKIEHSARHMDRIAGRMR